MENIERQLAKHLAIPYHLSYDYSDDKYNDLVGEFNINFDIEKNDLNKLIEFIEQKLDKRINIHFPNGVDIGVLKSIHRLFDNIYVRLDIQDIVKTAELRELNIPYFFTSNCLVSSYTLLDSFILLGVSDIYIADDLCYNIPDVSEYCHSKGVKLRLVLNEIPSTSFDKGINYKSPIYKPDDIEVLAKYIDTFEFNCGSPYQWNKFEVLYKTWFVNGYWHGDLQEINKDLHIVLYNDTMLPDWSRYKMKCGRRCNMRISNTCRKCEQFLEIQDLMLEKDIGYKRPMMGENDEL